MTTSTPPCIPHHFFLFPHNYIILYFHPQFCVNLPTVLQCLTLLGNLDRMKLTLSYNLTQELFQLELTDEAGVLSTASISGLQPPEDDDMTSLALAMRSSPIRARVIFQSAALREILVELDSVGGAKEGTVSLSSASLDISVVGDLSECQVSIPCRGEHVVSIECPAEGASHSFPLHSLLGSLRGLEIAHETCITINNNGMMAIQHQVIDPVTGDGSPCFVDFVSNWKCTSIAMFLLLFRLINAFLWYRSCAVWTTATIRPRKLPKKRRNLACRRTCQSRVLNP